MKALSRPRHRAVSGWFRLVLTAWRVSLQAGKASGGKGLSGCIAGDWSACEGIADSSADLARLLSSPPAPLLVATPSQQVHFLTPPRILLQLPGLPQPNRACFSVFHLACFPAC